MRIAGEKTDYPMLEQNGPPTEDVSLPFFTADGKPVTQLVSGINFQSHNVRYARVTQEPDAAGTAFLRQAGMCRE
jgi:hypothetical protein